MYLLFLVLVLLQVVVKAQNYPPEGRVDVAMESPEPEDHSQTLPFLVTGSCRDGHFLQLHVKPAAGDATPVPSPLTVLISGELDLFHHHETSVSEVKSGSVVEVNVPGWATEINGYVSVHVAAEGFLLGTLEFVKLAELCGLTAQGNEGMEPSFNGDLHSFRPKH